MGQPPRHSNRRLALLDPRYRMLRYLCLPPLSYPINRELYNASIVFEHRLGVNNRAAMEYCVCVCAPIAQCPVSGVIQSMFLPVAVLWCSLDIP